MILLLKHKDNVMKTIIKDLTKEYLSESSTKFLQFIALTHSLGGLSFILMKNDNFYLVWLIYCISIILVIAHEYYRTMSHVKGHITLFDLILIVLYSPFIIISLLITFVIFKVIKFLNTQII